MRINYKHKSRAIMALMAIALPVTFYYSCKKDLKASPPSDTLSEKHIGPMTRFANESVNVWETTTDQSKLLQQQANVNFAADGGTNPITITVDEHTTFQTIDGFGYALTGGSAQLIHGLGANENACVSPG